MGSLKKKLEIDMKSPGKKRIVRLPRSRPLRAARKHGENSPEKNPRPSSNKRPDSKFRNKKKFQAQGTRLQTSPVTIPIDDPVIVSDQVNNNTRTSKRIKYNKRAGSLDLLDRDKHSKKRSIISWEKDGFGRIDH